MLKASTNNKDFFRKWLKQIKSVEESSAIMATINMLDLLMRKNKTINYHITEIKNPDKIDDLIDGIKKNIVIRIHLKSQRMDTINALRAYKEFLNDEKFWREKKFKTKLLKV